MDSFKIEELKPNTVYKGDVLLDKLFLLCPGGCPLSQGTIDALKEWNFANISTDDNSSILTSTFIQEHKPAGDSKAQKKKSLSSKIEEVRDFVKATGEAPTVNPEIQKALDEAAQAAGDEKDEAAQLKLVKKVYDAYLTYIESVFTRYATHKDFKTNEIEGTIKELCQFIKKYRRYILNITTTQEEHKKRFLVYHSFRSSVFAIAIGLQLNMPSGKLIELGVTSLLHEIGMLRLPPQIYMSTRPLTNAEKTQMLTHPIISYNILKEAGFPLNIQLGVLDHHERENGTGYPRHSEGNNISLYGKIIAVACSFEAITAPREYKEERTSYEGMIEVLRNDNHQYDDTVIKALLYAVSLYPIGSYVYLSNGKIAQVVDANPNDPKNPIVQVIGAAGKPVQTNDGDTKIARVMNKKEAEDVIAALKKGGAPAAESPAAAEQPAAGSASQARAAPAS